MQKHANLFHIVMTLYAFGFIASLVFYRSDPSAPQTSHPTQLTIVPEASIDRGMSKVKAVGDPGAGARDPDAQGQKI